MGESGETISPVIKRADTVHAADMKWCHIGIEIYKMSISGPYETS